MANIMIESPSVLIIRLQFLDFARYTQWKPGWIIQPADASKQPLDLKPGDGLKVSMDGKAHNPVVVVGFNVTGMMSNRCAKSRKENSPKSFQWEGSLFGLGKGVHQFHFAPSETNPGGTTFTQGEDFRGLLITLSSPWWSGRKFDMDPWDKFNADLKNEVEKSSN